MENEDIIIVPEGHKITETLNEAVDAKKVISDYFRSLQKKSQETIKKRYGLNYFSQISKMSAKNYKGKRKVKRVKRVKLSKPLTP